MKPYEVELAPPPDSAATAPGTLPSNSAAIATKPYFWKPLYGHPAAIIKLHDFYVNTASKISSESVIRF